jgi:hypothetical protein
VKDFREKKEAEEVEEDSAEVAEAAEEDIVKKLWEKNKVEMVVGGNHQLLMG